MQSMTSRWSDKVKNAVDMWIDKVQKAQRPVRVVFDADGTLWRDDIGESFFKHQIKNNLIPRNNFQKGTDLWALYLEKVEQNTYEAYAWLAQLQKGLSEETLRAMSSDYFKTFEKNIFPEMRDLLSRLQSVGVEIWICSASIRWAVEPGAKILGIKNIIALETEVQQGIITDKKVLPLPYKEGKRKALEAKLKEKPFLVAGNSTGDLAMLEWAENQLIIGSAGPESIHYLSEQQIQEVARQKGWPVQLFSKG